MAKINSEDYYRKIIFNLQEKIDNQDEALFQLKSLIDSIPGDVYRKDKAGVWIGLNKHCAESLQRMGFIKKADENEVIGKTDYQLFDKITADGYRINDIEVMESKRE
nr:hybrid sensor histidine kinase/response regulator [Tatlockia sp.]